MHIAVPAHPVLTREGTSRPARYVALTTAAVALTLAAGALGARAQTDHPAAIAILRGATVGVPLIAVLWCAYTRQFSGFTRLLLLIGVVAAVASLAESGSPTAYTAGRLAGFGLELLLVIALLGFPHGVPHGRSDRAVAAAGALAFGAFALSGVIAEAFRLPSSATSCHADCPHSVVHLVTLPDAASSALVVFGWGLLFAVLIAAVVRLERRVSAAPAPLASALRPVLVAGVVHATLVGWAALGRADDPASAGSVTASDLVAWSIVGVGVAFLIGLVVLRLGDERALTRLAQRIGTATSPLQVQRAYAESFGARGVQLLTADQHAARHDPSRAVHELRDHRGMVLGALSCDSALDEQRPELVEAARVLGTVALENLQMARVADVAATEIAQSRARIAASADRERRRIERDLHDGAQQRLVALRIELGLVGDLVAHGDVQHGIERLHELEESVDSALEELRTLAHGVCPPLLADRGLIEALRAATARCPVPSRVASDGVQRYASEIESAVYFCVLEALQNVAKHARGARRALVTLRDDGRGRLQFSVRDDGAGALTGQVVAGAGLSNMRDRVEAVGGELRITMPRGAGAEVRGSIPV